jgi:hypothetical protein
LTIVDSFPAVGIFITTSTVLHVPSNFSTIGAALGFLFGKAVLAPVVIQLDPGTHAYDGIPIVNLQYAPMISVRARFCFYERVDSISNTQIRGSAASPGDYVLQCTGSGTLMTVGNTRGLTITGLTFRGRVDVPFTASALDVVSASTLTLTNVVFDQVLNSIRVDGNSFLEGLSLTISGMYGISVGGVSVARLHQSSISGGAGAQIAVGTTGASRSYIVTTQISSFAKGFSCGGGSFCYVNTVSFVNVPIEYDTTCPLLTTGGRTTS